MKKKSILIGLIILLVGFFIASLASLNTEYKSLQGKFSLNQNKQNSVFSCASENIDSLLKAEINVDTLKNNFKMIKNACPQKFINLSGELVTFSIHKEQKSEFSYGLTTSSDAELSLVPLFQFTKPYLSGTQVKISGILNSANEFFSDQTPMIIKEAVMEPIIGPQKTLALLVYFKNDIQPDQTDIQSLQENLRLTDSFLQESSYGKVSLTGVMDAGQSADVRGWYQLPIQPTCSGPLIGSATLTSVSDINFSQYSRLIIIGDFSDCEWDGLSTLGSYNMPTRQGLAHLSVSLIVYYMGYTTVAHELGHAFGLRHSNFLNCGSTSLPASGQTVSSQCIIETYQDLYSTMGSPFFSNHFTAPNKIDLDWLTPSNVKLLNQKGKYDVTLEPLEISTKGIQVVKIPFDNNSYLFLEYRQPIGFDSAEHDTLLYDGLLIYTDGFSAHNLANGGSILIISAHPPTERKGVIPLTQDRKFQAVGSNYLITVEITNNKRDKEHPENSRITARVTLE